MCYVRKAFVGEVLFCLDQQLLQGGAGAVEQRVVMGSSVDMAVFQYPISQVGCHFDGDAARLAGEGRGREREGE